MVNERTFRHATWARPSSETQGQLVGRNKKINRGLALRFLPGLFLCFAPLTAPGSPRMGLDVYPVLAIKKVLW